MERYELVLPGRGLARRQAVHAGRPNSAAADAAIHQRRAVVVAAAVLLVCLCSTISGVRMGGVARIIALILAGETGLVGVLSSVLVRKLHRPQASRR